MKTQMKMILKRPLKGSINTNLENRLAPSNARLMGRRVIKVKVLKVKAPKGKAPSTKVPKVKLGLQHIVQFTINKVCHFYKPGSMFLATQWLAIFHSTRSILHILFMSNLQVHLVHS